MKFLEKYYYCCCWGEDCLFSPAFASRSYLTWVIRALSSLLGFLPGLGILTSFYPFSCSRVSKSLFPFSCCSFVLSHSEGSREEHCCALLPERMLHSHRLTRSTEKPKVIFAVWPWWVPAVCCFAGVGHESLFLIKKPKNPNKTPKPKPDNLLEKRRAIAPFNQEFSESSE